MGQPSHGHSIRHGPRANPNYARRFGERDHGGRLAAIDAARHAQLAVVDCDVYGVTSRAATQAMSQPCGQFLAIGVVSQEHSLWGELFARGGQSRQVILAVVFAQQFVFNDQDSVCNSLDCGDERFVGPAQHNCAQLALAAIGQAAASAQQSLRRAIHSSAAPQTGNDVRHDASHLQGVMV